MVVLAEYQPFLKSQNITVNKRPQKVFDIIGLIDLI